MIPERHRKKAAVAALCVTCIAGYEGLRTAAYQDANPHRIWTICYGETADVKPGDRATAEECKAMLAQRVERDFITGVEACVKRDMPVKVEAAFVSLGYNIGITTFCKSSVVRKWNEGREVEACEAMLLYNRAGGVVLKGLSCRESGKMISARAINPPFTISAGADRVLELYATNP